MYLTDRSRLGKSEAMHDGTTKRDHPGGLTAAPPQQKKSTLSRALRPMVEHSVEHV